jgi:hypothetical protein
LRKDFFNKKREKCLVSHFECFCNEKNIRFPSDRIVRRTDLYSDTIAMKCRHYPKAMVSLS